MELTVPNLAVPSGDNPADKMKCRSLFLAEGSDGFLGTDFFRILQKKYVVTNTSEPPVGECKILRNSLSHGMFSVA